MRVADQTRAAPTAAPAEEEPSGPTVPVLASGIASAGASIMAAQAVNRRNRWLIDPRHSKYLGAWDALTGLALVFTALVTPFEVALLETTLDALFWVNRGIDVLFCFDIVKEFFLIYMINGRDGAEWITDHKKICLKYLRSWFVLDVTSIGVSAFDIIAVAGAGRGLADLKAFRVIRALRLIKMIRLLRASRMFQR